MAIPAISPNITLEVFQAKSGLIAKTTARSVLEYLVKRGIGQISRQRYSFSRADRMKVAILALQSGNDIETVSKYLTWQDFESFASDLLNLAGYVAERDLRFSKPIRMQIDVLGVNYNSQLAYRRLIVNTGGETTFRRYLHVQEGKLRGHPNCYFIEERFRMPFLLY